MFSPLLKVIKTEKKFLALFAAFIMVAAFYIHPVLAQTTPTETQGNTFAANDTTNESSNTDDESSASGANTYFLKIDGIPGDSNARGHEDEIVVDSFSWGVSQKLAAAGGGGGAGKAVFDEFTFRTTVSKASPLLFLNSVNGKHIKEAKLTVRKNGESQQDYYIVKLSDVVITSYRSAGHNDNVPVDNVTLNFAKIEYEFKEQKADGTLGTSTKAGWDLKANKGI